MSAMNDEHNIFTESIANAQFNVERLESNFRSVRDHLAKVIENIHIRGVEEPSKDLKESHAQVNQIIEELDKLEKAILKLRVYEN